MIGVTGHFIAFMCLATHAVGASFPSVVGSGSSPGQVAEDATPPTLVPKLQSTLLALFLDPL